MRTTLEQKDKLIDQLRGEVASSQAARERFRDVPAELHAVDPRIVGVRIADAPDWNATSGWSAGITLLVTVRTSAPLGRGETDRITGWLRVRLKTDAVRLIVESDR